MKNIMHPTRSPKPPGVTPKGFGVKFEEDVRRTGLRLLVVMLGLASLGICGGMWRWKGVEAAISTWGSYYTFTTRFLELVWLF